MLSHWLCWTLCNSMDYNPPGSSVHGDSPGKNTGVGSHALLQGIFPTPGIKPRSPTLQVDSLPSEPPGKPKNTGVRSLSLLQGISQSQDSNWRLLHCRRILDQLSYQGMLFVKVTANALTLPSVHQLPKVRRTNLYFLLQPET